MWGRFVHDVALNLSCGAQIRIRDVWNINMGIYLYIVNGG